MKIGDSYYSIQMKTLTVSCGFDKYNDGRKDSNFISAGFELPEGLSDEDINLVAVDLSKKITQATYLTALGRGAITKDEYKILYSGSNTRHDEIQSVILKKKSGKEDGTDSW